MKKIAVLIAGGIAWLGCIALLAQALIGLFTFKMRAFGVGIPIIAIHAVGFWFFYRAYQNNKQGIAPPAPAQSFSMSFLFCLTPFLIIAADMVLLKIVTSFDG